MKLKLEPEAEAEAGDDVDTAPPRKRSWIR